MIPTLLKVIFYLFIIQIAVSILRSLFSVKINNNSEKNNDVIDVDYEEVE